jgi:glycine betaine/choline ABC-type transport system substrate-binding protein
VTVGSTNFSEQLILAQMYAAVLAPLLDGKGLL